MGDRDRRMLLGFLLILLIEAVILLLIWLTS